MQLIMNLMGDDFFILLVLFLLHSLMALSLSDRDPGSRTCFFLGAAPARAAVALLQKTLKRQTGTQNRPSRHQSARQLPPPAKHGAGASSCKY